MRLLSLPLVALAAASSAATFTYTTGFDATFDDTLSAPYVGSATLTYEAPSQLADGYYSWTSLLNSYGMTFSATFDLPEGGTTAFDASHLFAQYPGFPELSQQDLYDGTYVTLSNGSFYLTNATVQDSGDYVGHPGSALFSNGEYNWAAEPISLNGRSAYRETSFDRALFTFGAGTSFSGIYTGSYGTSFTDGRSLGAGGGVVPEPSAYGVALGLLALAGAAIRRRRK